nr:MAG TPA: hypothetical protein [Bacteriophage sp.]
MLIQKLINLHLIITLLMLLLKRLSRRLRLTLQLLAPSRINLMMAICFCRLNTIVLAATSNEKES